uniref:Uncharacterized protein n=1 Tax=Trichuris muris TaxID=70415 RepID=A0A5S6QNF2_TRIMR
MESKYSSDNFIWHTSRRVPSINTWLHNLSCPTLSPKRKRASSVTQLTKISSHPFADKVAQIREETT